MNQKVRSFLIELARKKSQQLISYQKLSDTCSLGLNMQDNPSDRSEMGRILGEISVFEHENERPLLSALVIRSGDHYEGDGFYKLAEELGYGDWKKLKDDDLFAVKQINESIAFWTKNKNYDEFK